jgi:hypothetical protein
VGTPTVSFAATSTPKHPAAVVAVVPGKLEE